MPSLLSDAQLTLIRERLTVVPTTNTGRTDWEKWYLAMLVELPKLFALVDQFREQRAEFEKALSNHLCQHDMADWLVCAGGHGEDCAVCSENDKGQHRHALLARAEAAEASAKEWREAYQSLAKEYGRG